MLGEASLVRVFQQNKVPDGRSTDSLVYVTVADAEFLADAFVSRAGGRKVAGGFSLNYDVETPIRPIDVGGPDQEQRFVCVATLFKPNLTVLFSRLADFVTRSIENTGNGLTVKEAMKRLGLKEYVVCPVLLRNTLIHIVASGTCYQGSKSDC